MFMHRTLETPKHAMNGRMQPKMRKCTESGTLACEKKKQKKDGGGVYCSSCAVPCKPNNDTDSIASVPDRQREAHQFVRRRDTSKKKRKKETKSPHVSLSLWAVSTQLSFFALVVSFSASTRSLVHEIDRLWTPYALFLLLESPFPSINSNSFF